MDPTLSPDDIYLAVMGVTGAGKSTFINYFSETPVPVGDDLESCTEDIGLYRCTVPGVPSLYLIDTPGFDDTNRSDADVLEQLAKHLAQAYHSKIKLSGLIYLHRISEPRFSGASRRNLRMFKKLCGDDNLGSVVLATTFWKTPATPIEVQREDQLKTDVKMWQPMVASGSRVMRQDRHEASGADIIKYLLNRRQRVVLNIQHELVDQKKTIAQTAAGTEVLAELAEMKAKHEQEIRKLKKEMEEAIEARDELWKAEIAKERAEKEAAIARDEKAKGKLRVKFGEFLNDAVEFSDAILWEIKYGSDGKKCCLM